MKLVANLFERIEISHPLVEYNNEALELVLNLKNEFKRNVGLLTDNNKIDEMVFDNICQRRVTLTKKLLILDNCCSLFKKYIINGREEIKKFKLNPKGMDTDEFRFNIDGSKFNLKEFCWTFKFAMKLFKAEEVNSDQMIKTKEYLDENFDFENYCLNDHSKNILNQEKHKEEVKKQDSKENKISNHTLIKGSDDILKCSCNHDCHSHDKDNLDEVEDDNKNELHFSNNENKLELKDPSSFISQNVINLCINKSNDLEATQNENIELEGYKYRLNKQKQEVEVLQNEKSKLENQKQKAENILTLLKTFVQMKEYYWNNKSKFAFMLIFISEVKAGKTQFTDLNLIRNILDFYAENQEQINNWAYSDFDRAEYNEFNAETAEIIDTEEENFNTNNKLKYIDDAFNKMESYLYVLVQAVLNDC